MAFQMDAFQPDTRELLARMRRFEDSFVERKPLGDRRDWLRTAVAFANSTPESKYAVMYLGVTDRGEIQEHNDNLETLQKTLRKELDKAYPTINYMSVVIEENSRLALAVIFPHSKKRPPFAGPAYVRIGAESIPATEEQFNELIARRNSKANKLLDHKGQFVTVMNSTKINGQIHESMWGGPVRIYDCDDTALTLAIGTDPKDRSMFPLSQVEVLFDHVQNRLLLKLDRF
ncbi:MAG: ATP-binding protein [Candidatus Acidiferrum sp.]